MKISDEDLRKIVNDVAGEDPFWNIPVYDVVKKIIDLPEETDFGIGDLIDPNYNISTMSTKMQKDIYDSVIEVCKKINIYFLETSPENRMNEHSFTWALTKKGNNVKIQDSPYNPINNDDEIVNKLVDKIESLEDETKFSILELVKNSEISNIENLNLTKISVDTLRKLSEKGIEIKPTISGIVGELEGIPHIKVGKNSVNGDINKYRFYKDKITNKTWWVDNRGVKGEMLFTFDKKKIYNLFRDYPYELSSEEIEIFDKENPYWADFFKDRKQSLERVDIEKLKKDIDYEKRIIDEYFEKRKCGEEEHQKKLESIKKLFFENNVNFFDVIKMYLNETLDYDILNNPYNNTLRFEIFDKKNKKKMFFAINKNLFVLNAVSNHKLSLRGDSSNEIFSSLISQLEDITKEWNLCYPNDGEYYWGVTICNNNKCNLYVGNSSFPNNWSKFIEIINNVIKNLMDQTNAEIKKIYLNQTEQ